jgi:hypothetical protein
MKALEQAKLTMVNRRDSRILQFCRYAVSILISPYSYLSNENSIL